jgi:hypothetical protein
MALLRPPPSPPPASLEARIEQLRADIDSYIDQRVEAERLLCPGIPAESLRQMLVRGTGCQCAAYLHLAKDAT